MRLKGRIRSGHRRRRWSRRGRCLRSRRGRGLGACDAPVDILNLVHERLYLGHGCAKRTQVRCRGDEHYRAVGIRDGKGCKLRDSSQIPRTVRVKPKTTLSDLCHYSTSIGAACLLYEIPYVLECKDGIIVYLDLDESIRTHVRGYVEPETPRGGVNRRRTCWHLGAIPGTRTRCGHAADCPRPS